MRGCEAHSSFHRRHGSFESGAPAPRSTTLSRRSALLVEAEDDLQDVVQGNDPGFAAGTVEDNRDALAGALHLAQSAFETHFAVKEQRGPHEIAGGLRKCRAERQGRQRRLESPARSPSGLGRFPFKEEVMGSNPIRATAKRRSREMYEVLKK